VVAHSACGREVTSVEKEAKENVISYQGDHRDFIATERGRRARTRPEWDEKEKIPGTKGKRLGHGCPGGTEKRVTGGLNIKDRKERDLPTVTSKKGKITPIWGPALPAHA